MKDNKNAMVSDGVHVHVPPPKKRAEILLELAKMGRLLASAINSPTASVIISNNTINGSGISIDTIPNDVNDNDCHGE